MRRFSHAVAGSLAAIIVGRHPLTQSPQLTPLLCQAATGAKTSDLISRVGPEVHRPFIHLATASSSDIGYNIKTVKG